MHSTSSSFAPPLHARACSSYFPNPNSNSNSSPKPITLRPTTTRTRRNNTCQPLITQTHSLNYSFYPLPATNDCSNRLQQSSSSSLLFHKNQNYGFFLRRPNSSIHINNKANRTRKKRIEKKERNMWWVDLKAALGQRINLEGLVCSVSVISRDRHLALPHVSVRDIRHIDWVALKEQGFQGVVFDKDNTLTVPYSLNLWGPLASSIESCKSVFGNNIAVFSNSAGLHEYDPDGRKARALEFMIGIKVIRHGVKKPAGTGEEVERHFGCESSRLIMVGDRPFTDIVFGNRNGFLTILTEPLSLAEEPFIVKQVRKIELTLVNRWSKRGFKPSIHSLLPDALQCVKDLPHL